MHEGLYKKWKNTDTIRSIYSRLYEHTTYYDTIENFLPSIVNQVLPDSHSITSIIG